MSIARTLNGTSNLVELAAVDVVAAFKDGSLTPTDYLSECLEHISRINPSINALTVIDEERAIPAAEQATQRWKAGQPLGPLDGLPIGIKDLQNTKGLLTTFGSVRARDNVPDNDLPMVARLRAAGAIILAKTNVPEMGAGGNSRNIVWGATGNPFNTDLIAGGSSGGSAAALAANLLPLCTGSDTGGSLRVPAALCGVVGFRPSVDVIAHPTRPLGWSGISVLGPMARTMDDLLLMLRVCQGHHADDPLSMRSDPDRFKNPKDLNLKELRVGYSENFGDAPVDADIRQCFQSRIDMLKPQFKTCTRVDLNLGQMDRTFDILRAESFIAAFGDIAEKEPDSFGQHIVDNLAIGSEMTLADRAWAHKEQTNILRKFNALMQDFDIILLPTSPVSPFSWKQPYVNNIDGQTMDNYYRWLALAYRGSLTGGPAITLPCGRDTAGMPFGLQVLGAVRSDPQLLDAACALEAFFASNPSTTRPSPCLTHLYTPNPELRSIVTHPPSANDTRQGRQRSIETAV